MKQSDNTNRTPANWDGTPQEDYFADWNTPPEEYPAAGRASLAGSAGRILCRARRLLRPPGRLLCAARCLLRPTRARGARRGRGRRRIRREVRRRLCRRRGRAGGGSGRRFLCPRGPRRNAGGAEREAEKEKAPPQRGLSAVSCHGHRACDRRAGGHRQSAGAKSG